MPLCQTPDVTSMPICAGQQVSWHSTFPNRFQHQQVSKLLDKVKYMYLNVQAVNAHDGTSEFSLNKLILQTLNYCIKINPLLLFSFIILERAFESFFRPHLDFAE